MNKVSRVNAWLASNISEIDDPVLKWFGIYLCANLIQTSISWGLLKASAALFTDESVVPLCWPGLEWCYRLFPLPKNYSDISMVFVCTIAAAGLFAFWRERWKWAYWLSLTAYLGKALGYFLDLRHMGNYHYMPNWTALVFFFLPGKIRVLPPLITLFYFSAGLLKLNSEWLSGNALVALPPVTGIPLEMATSYVVILELILIFGLLSRHAGIFWSVFAQVVFFHVVSWQQVGYYYPVTMLGMVTIFPLMWFYHPELRGEYLRFSKVPKVSLACLGLLILAQMPQFVLSNDSAVTGAGRIFSLNMLDAHTSCDAFYIVRDKAGNQREVRRTELDRTDYGIRMQCDPFVYMRIGQHLCRTLTSDPEFVDFDFYLLSKRYSDRRASPIVRYESFCANMPDYYSLTRNKWVHDVYDR